MNNSACERGGRGALVSAIALLLALLALGAGAPRAQADYELRVCDADQRCAPLATVPLATGSALLDDLPQPLSATCAALPIYGVSIPLGSGDGIDLCTVGPWWHNHNVAARLGEVLVDQYDYLLFETDEPGCPCRVSALEISGQRFEIVARPAAGD